MSWISDAFQEVEIVLAFTTFIIFVILSFAVADVRNDTRDMATRLQQLQEVQVHYRLPDDCVTSDPLSARLDSMSVYVVTCPKGTDLGGARH